MLPTPAHVRAVYTGSDLAAAGAAVAAGAPVSSSEVVPGAGLLDIAQAGTILMDCSTIDPASAGTLSAAARERGLRALDAPVSGGVTGAAAGTLTFMLGGSPDDAAAVDPLLASMGKARLHCGDLPGSGQAAKLCNNMLLAVTMVGAAEAMKLGAHLGLDSARLAGVLNVSTGRSWSTDTYNPAPGALANENLPANRDYAGGFANVLMNKDLGLALSAARREDVATPISDLAGRIYATLAEDPAYRGLDFGSVYKWLGSQKRADCSAAEAQEKKVSC
ncbi:hypothetical protein H696_00559 [Fonticula alba]|uniref:3-hydroxyisobutyrate dehydrogenase n=1 Tax=Fonticula alba TaxID=691883 RepID=A0A058ZF85_FONAL|nr:hypothetical protein H696_00559 [Fonticula alba]KCV73009.1 hypothetical protein H696_00559 [Fonticula alba]|eukprot:XP_009492710.1 hypothetical protein H696_00559 [Fonticula alba]